MVLLIDISTFTFSGDRDRVLQAPLKKEFHQFRTQLPLTALSFWLYYLREMGQVFILPTWSRIPPSVGNKYACLGGHSNCCRWTWLFPPKSPSVARKENKRFWTPRFLIKVVLVRPSTGVTFNFPNVCVSYLRCCRLIQASRWTSQAAFLHRLTGSYILCLRRRQRHYLYLQVTASPAIFFGTLYPLVT